MKNPLQLINRQELFIVFGITMIITLVSIVLIVLSVSTRNRNTLLAGQERLELERQALSRSTGFGIENYYRDSRESELGVTYSVRQRQRTWSKEDIGFYWIDPAEAGIENLKGNNDALIRDSLGIDDK